MCHHHTDAIDNADRRNPLPWRACLTISTISRSSHTGCRSPAVPPVARRSPLPGFHMKLAYSLRTSLLAIAIALPAIAQQPASIKIRALTAPLATSVSVAAVGQLREIAGSKVLVNDDGNRALMLFDATLQHPTVL